MTDKLNRPAPDNDDDLVDEDPPRDRPPTDDEYAELLKRAVEKMIVGEGLENTRERERQRERVWNAFHDWVDDWTEEGVFDKYEIQALVFLFIGGHNERWYRARAANVRAEVEAAFFGEYVSQQPKEVQIDVLAGLLRAAEDYDKRSQPLFSWVTQLSKTMSREEVARAMQAATDAYRAGQPLRMKDRVALLAHEHLPEKTRVRTMAAALGRNGSKAAYLDDAANQLVSKATDECADPLPDPHDFRIGVRLAETYPLVRNMISHLFERGIIQHKTLREAWSLDGGSQEVLAGIDADYGLESLIAVIDEQHEALKVFRHLAEVHRATKAAESLQRTVDDDETAERRQVADPQQVAGGRQVEDPEQQDRPVAEPEQL